MKEKIKKEEELSAGESGAFFGAMLFTLALLVIFSISPVAHYFSEWNNYWNPSPVDTSDTPDFGFGYIPPAEPYDNWGNANDDCNHRAIKKFGPHNFSTASSTSGTFTTYDCWATPLQKI
ncbi:MAG: hypothetical protein V4509_01550 [Patescibacteria group bacterium]